MRATAARRSAQPKILLYTLIATATALTACGGDDDGPAPPPTSSVGGGNTPPTPFPPANGGYEPEPGQPSAPNEPSNPQQPDSEPDNEPHNAPEPESLAIVGTPPAAARTDTTYDFLPQAHSPGDDDSLVFDIKNKPGWASFDKATGRLTGKPKNNHLGKYREIIITVSDGEEMAELEFSIDVVQTASGSVALSWEPPLERADGTPLADLAGYKIYWGTVEGEFMNSVTIENPSVSSYVVEELTPAYYYMVATAVDSEGLESQFSNVVEAEIE